MAAVTEPLYAQRSVDLPPLEIEYVGGVLPAIDSISMQVRLYQGASGSALISKTDVIFTDEADPTDADPDLRVLALDTGITAAELTALPGLNTPEAGDDQAFWQEIKIHYDDGEEESLWLSQLIVNPGVNTL
jgi:hypothetical protein